MNYSYLWNNLPEDERRRLHPFLIQSQILHIQQVRAMVVVRQKQLLSDIDGWIKNLESALPKPDKLP